MKPIIRKYLKTFLLAGLTYGLIMLGFDLASGEKFNVWEFLFTTILFGFIMSLILVSFQIYILKKKGIKEITKENLAVKQTKTVTCALNKTELIEKLKNDPIFEK